MMVKLLKGSKFKNGDESPEIKELLQTLYDEGYLLNEKLIDGIWGSVTEAALDAYERDERDKLFGAGRLILRGIGNLARNPVQAAIDMILWRADKAGAPSNVTNYLRDLNVAIPYRAKALPTALIRSIGDMSFSEAYEDALRHPSRYMNLTTIRPMPNTNSNYSDEEVEVVEKLLNGKDYITNTDLKAKSPNGKVGSGNVSLWDYVTVPEYIVQTSIGETSKRSGHPGVAYDIFDTNTETLEAKRDNKKYRDNVVKNIKNGKNPFNYSFLRAALPYIGTIDIFPDEYKIQTQIDTRDENNN